MEEETQQQINSLKKQVEDLTTLVDKNSKTGGFLDRYLDDKSKDIILEVVKDNLAEIWWDDVFYISSVFESIDRYTVIASTTISSAGLSLSTTDGETSATLQAKDNNPIMANRKTYVSTPVGIADVSEVVYYFSILDDSVYMGIDAGAIKGYTNDGIEYSVPLGTAVDNTPYLLELVYYPGSRVDFFVDGTLKGSLTKGLIPTRTVISNIITFSLAPKTGGSAVSTAEITHFSLLQKK